MMGQTILRKLAVTAVIATGALALPAMASAATPPPPLQAGDTQAFASLTSGGPPITAPITRTFQGTLTIGIGAFQMTCSNVNAIVDLDVDGTGSVGSMAFPGCSTNIPGCNADLSATGIPWGTRLVRDASGVFRERINVGPETGSPLTDQGVVWNLMGVCPWPAGPYYIYSGVLSPAVTGGTPAVMTLDALAGGLSSPLMGSISLSGTVDGYSGEALFPVL